MKEANSNEQPGIRGFNGALLRTPTAGARGSRGLPARRFRRERWIHVNWASRCCQL